jgi:hypothetical protein
MQPRDRILGDELVMLHLAQQAARRRRGNAKHISATLDTRTSPALTSSYTRRRVLCMVSTGYLGSLDTVWLEPIDHLMTCKHAWCSSSSFDFETTTAVHRKLFC